MFRLIFLAAIFAIGYYLVKLFIKRDTTIRCSRCDGKGFWYAARGRETCDWCKGSGRLPRG